jgi:hypothetical protein
LRREGWRGRERGDVDSDLRDVRCKL